MSTNKPFYLFLLIAAITAAIFLIRPDIDLWASGLFYNDQEHFFIDKIQPVIYIHKSVKYLTISIALLWISLLVINHITKKELLGLTKKQLIYLILALALGPGLVVNAIFKDNWGRARPHHIQEFAGNKQFTPPFIITDQCERNCSFVSGDPSVGFYFFALAFVFHNRKKLFYSVALGLGTILGSVRIMLGAHFLSDVIFSGVFTFLVCYLLYKWMFKNDK